MLQGVQVLKDLLVYGDAPVPITACEESDIPPGATVVYVQSVAEAQSLAQASGLDEVTIPVEDLE